MKVSLTEPAQNCTDSSKRSSDVKKCYFRPKNDYDYVHHRYNHHFEQNHAKKTFLNILSLFFFLQLFLSFISEISIINTHILHRCLTKTNSFIFRWFKFTLKPPYSIAHDKLRLAIWDTSFWTFWLKFGHKGP